MSIGPNGLDIEVGDIDGDGDEDLIQSGGNGVVGVLVSRGDGTFYSVAWINVGHVQDTHVEDMNRDGRDDVVTSDGSTIRYYAGNGEAMLQNALSYPSQGSSRIQIGDVNGDGHRASSPTEEQPFWAGTPMSSMHHLSRVTAHHQESDLEISTETQFPTQSGDEVELCRPPYIVILTQSNRPTSHRWPFRFLHSRPNRIPIQRSVA